MGKQSRKKAMRRARRQRGESTAKPPRWRMANIAAKGRRIEKVIERQQAAAGEVQS